MLVRRKRRMRWLVYLFPTQNSVSESPLHPHWLQGTAGPGEAKALAGRLPGPGYGLLVWKCYWAMLGDTCSWKPLAASHSFIRGLIATGCPWRALPWIQLVADPIGAQLHKLMDHCLAISMAHLLRLVPGAVPSLLITSTTGFVFRWFSFQVNSIERIYLAHFAQKGRLWDGSFYLLRTPGL